ncbi:MAG: hypothetical protein WCG07_01660 [Candidatus Taylorbacteria bacterium]
MGLLRTNEVPPNPHAQPEKFQEHMSGKAKPTLVAEESELPGEARYKLLKDSNGVYFWDGTHLFQFLLWGGRVALCKNFETGEPKSVTVYGKETLVRLQSELDSFTGE